MKLYYSKGSCSLAVRIILNEMGIECDFEAVNIKTKKTETGEDFYKINSKGYVPVLAIADNQRLSENLVIQTYLADTHPAAGLLPPLSDFNRYRVLEWLVYISTEIHKNFGALFNPEISEDLKAKLFIPMIQKKFRYLDSQLIDKSFLMGDRFTLPDSYLFVMLLWSQRMLPNGIADYPQLGRYFSQLKDRSAVKKSLEQENI